MRWNGNKEAQKQADDAWNSVKFKFGKRRKKKTAKQQRQSQKPSPKKKLKKVPDRK